MTPEDEAGEEEEQAVLRFLDVRGHSVASRLLVSSAGVPLELVVCPAP